MSHKKKYNSLNELPFFNVNKSYVKMDAVQALSVLESSLRKEDGYLSPLDYSALCSLKNIIKAQQKRINKIRRTER